MPTSRPDEYRFDRFRLVPGQRRLLEGDKFVKLGGRAFDTLLVLVQEHERAVPKDELIERVWPQLVVEENNLQVQIAAIRKVLGAAAITTIPGRGYRFAAPVESVATADAEAAPQPAADIGAPAPHASPDSTLERAGTLYGRDQDMVAVRDLLERYCIVSIVGPAGIGKTRLAAAVALDLRDRYAERVQVDLAPLGEADLVMATVARALGLTVGDALAAIDVIVRALVGQRMLLVLDNCEHVLEAVDEVVAAIRAGAPDVRVLVASQEVLRLADEHVYRLGALALPVDETLSSAREAGAVELFVARAQALDRRFVLGDENVATVVEICRRLDGIPLAIELAAARVPLLGVEGVRDRLDERFRLLTAGSRLTLRRHQTLRAAMEWSYSLLSEEEQSVFEKLGVFAGTFSLECAQQLATDERTDAWAALDHLGALVDKSLVGVEAGNVARYRMLETARAFALERLAARGTTAQTMHRHAQVMLERFEGLQRDLREGTPSAKVSEMFAAELDNLRAALSWAGETGGDRGIAIALFGAAIASHGYFYYAPLKARHWIDTLRPLVDDSIPPADAARFWLACADWSTVHSPGAVVDDALRAIALYRELDDRLGSCRAWMAMAYSLAVTGRLDEARHALDETLRFCDPTWPPWLVALVDNTVALVLCSLGEPSEARRYALALLSASRQMSKDVDECVALTILIEIDIATGNVHEAAATAVEMLEHHPAIWEKTEDGRSLRAVATALMCADRLDEAEPLYREALTRVRRNYGNASFVLYDLAMFMMRRGRVDEAARALAYEEEFHRVRGLRARLVARLLRDRLAALLAAERAPDALAKLYDEGRRMTDDEICAMALPVGAS